MKNHIFILVCILPLNVLCQNLIYQPQDNRQTNQMLMNALDNAQRKYDANLNYSNQLINWAINLKGQTSEPIFINKMDEYIKQLRKLQGGDLHSYSARLAQLETSINEEIVNYNKRQDAIERKKEIENAPQTHWEKGKAFFDANNYYGAITEFNSVLKTVPDDASSYYYLAESYRQTNDPINAEKCYKSAIMLNPVPEVYERLGWFYMDESKPIQALSSFNMQVELAPNVVNGYYNRGSAKSDLKDYNGAISDYEKGIALNPDIAILYNNLAWSYYLKEDYTEALKQINIALQKEADYAVIWDTKADIAFALKEYRTCIECANNALKIDHKLYNSYFIRGRANYRLGNHAEACEDWSLAGQYGKEEAYEYIKKYCNGK